MKKYYLKGIVIFMILIISSQSCVKKSLDLDRISGNMEWDPNMAVPLIKTTLTIRDILQDYDSMELFVEDATGFLFLMYESQIFSLKAKELITIPDQNFPNNIFTGSEFISQGFNSTISTATVSHSIDQNLAFSGTQQMDSILIDSIQVNIGVMSGFLHTGEVNITFPTIKKNGTPYSKTIQINSSDGSFNTSQYYYDMGGYTMDLTSTGTSNQIPIETSMTLYDSGNTINSTDQGVVLVSFSMMDYSVMYGYMGQDTMAYDDTLHLEIFNNFFQGDAHFEDPHFNIFVNNSYGLPITMLFSDFTTKPTGGAAAQTFAFSSDFSLNPLNINYPSVVGQIEETDIVLNKTNSQVVNIVNEAPKYILFSVAGMLNPLGNTGQQNFISEDSQFDLDIEIELPLWGTAEYFVLQDTADLDMTEIYDDLDPLEWFKLRLNVDNGMPTEVGIQVYFCELDTIFNGIDTTFNYIVVDSAFNPINRQIIESGILDASGKVIASSHKLTEILFDRAKIEKLKNVKKAFFTGYIFTTNQASEAVRFYSNYTLDMKASIQSQFHFEENDF